MSNTGVIAAELSRCCADDAYRGWADFFRREMQAPYFQVLDEKVTAAMESGEVYPPREDIFRTFRIPVDEIKCVILGQDPYHEPEQAMGLAFSVREGIKAPPSLVNIQKEILSDLGTEMRSTDLSGWVESGVFLLNTCLTVDRGNAFSHADFGWQQFTLHALEYVVACQGAPLAAILWGKPAQKYAPVFHQCSRETLVICSPHPSPLSAYRGFFGSRPFSRVNDFLRRQNMEPIHWA